MLIRWQKTIVDRQGNVQPGAVLTVRREANQSLAKVYRDRNRADPYPTGTVTADENGYAYFYADADTYRITSTKPAIDWRDEGLTTAVIDFAGQTYISYDSPSDKRMVDDTSQPVGTLGRVTNDTDPGKNGDWVMTAGGWEWAGVQPATSGQVQTFRNELQGEVQAEAATRMAQITSLAAPDIAEGTAVQTSDDHELLGFDRDGTARMVSGIRMYTAEADSNDDAGRLHLFRADSGTGIDPLILAVNPETGLLSLGALDQDSLARLSHDIDLHGAKPTLGRRTVANAIALIWQSGQSLSLGAIGNGYGANKPYFLSPTPYTPYGWMFNTGMRGAMGGTLNAAAITDFVPAQDVWDSRWNGDFSEIENRGQVPGSSMMARLAYENALSGTLMDTLWRGHGRGGRRISQLQADSGSFQNGYIELQKAISIAAEYGRTVFLPAIMWTQGEQERSPGNDPPTTVSGYKADLVTLLNSYNEYYLPLLPDDHPEIVMIIDQVAGNTTAEPINPASLAQYEAMRDIPGFYMCGPKYWAELSDSVHLVPWSYALLGEYQAQAWHEICVKGNTNFRPTMPQSIVRSGTTITLTLRTPFGDRIAFDTTTLPLQTNYGFEYDNANIVSVTLADSAAGVITIELDAAVGGTLGYAATGTGTSSATRPGAWGNVRDMSLKRSVTVPDKRLYNWLVTFQETVA